MNQLKDLFSAAIPQSTHGKQIRPWKRFCWDALLAVVSTMMITLILSGFHLYPDILNISLVYLLAVLVLGSTRGLFAAVSASILAF